MDIFPSLQTGGTPHCVTKDKINKPKVLFEELEKSKLNVWTSTPSFVQMCLMDPGFTQELLPEAEVFMFCGEAPGRCGTGAVKPFSEGPRIQYIRPD